MEKFDPAEWGTETPLSALWQERKNLLREKRIAVA
jgi:hypothetical protein